MAEVYRGLCSDCGSEVERVPELPGKKPFCKRREGAVEQASPFCSGWIYVNIASMRMTLACSLMFTMLLAGQEKRLTFDVASVKPSNPPVRGIGIRVMPGGKGWMIQGVQLRFMIGYFYSAPRAHVTGGPAWLDGFWDIVAKADRPHDLEDLRTMFRNLLADELKLKLRNEVKEGPIYALTIDKSGLKMKRDEDPWDYEESIKVGRDGIAVGKRVSMQRLCWSLQQILANDGRPVVDKTGLTGYYDYTLDNRPVLPPGSDIENLPARMRDRPSIFDAVREQLGLRLEAQKGPVDYYVVEHVEDPRTND